jgi:hypothetical protein
MLYPPTTAIGQIQTDLESVKGSVRRLDALYTNVANLEYSFREVRTEINGILNRLQELENKIWEITNEPTR